MMHSSAASRPTPTATPGRPGRATGSAGLPTGLHRPGPPRGSATANGAGAPPAARPVADDLKGAKTPGEALLLDNWVAIQGINLMRHARSLRPFAKDEFGTGPAAPSESHIEAVNRFLDSLRA